VSARQVGGLARTVPLHIALRANIESRKTAAGLLRRRPDIESAVIDNNHPPGEAVLIADRQKAIEHLEGQAHEYDKLFKELLNDTVRLYERGEIPEDIAIGLVGKPAIANRRGELRPINRLPKSWQQNVFR